MKRCLAVLKTESVFLLRQSKMLLILFFLVILYESILSPMRSLCDETGMTLQITEPFILLCTHSTNIVLAPIIYLFLLSHFPFCTTQYFQIIRTGKQQWFFGELLFIVISAFLFLLTLLVGSVFCVWQYCGFDTAWSSFMTKMRQEFPLQYAQNPLLFLSASTVAHGKPLQVFIFTFCMFWIYLIIIGLFLLTGTIIAKRTFAIILSTSLTLVGGTAVYFGSNLRWLLLLSHMEYGSHFNSIFSDINFPICGSILFYTLYVIGVLVFCQIGLRKMRIGEES